MPETLSTSNDATAVSISCIFFGLYVSTFMHALRWLLFTDNGWKFRPRKQTNWGMVLTTVSIFGCELVNLSLSLRGLTGAVKSLESAHANAIESSITLLSNRPTVVAVITCTTANLSVLIADCIMIHRCYAACARSRRMIVFPVVLWLGGIVLTVLQAYVQIVQHKQLASAWLPVNMQIGPGTVLTPFWGSTIVLNGYCTFVIAYRIMTVVRKSESAPGALHFALRVLVESGFLYLAIATAHFIVWWTPNSFAITVIGYLNTSVAGITFNLISIRTAKYRAQEILNEVNAQPLSALQFAPVKSTLLDSRPLDSNHSIKNVHPLSMMEVAPVKCTDWNPSSVSNSSEV